MRVGVTASMSPPLSAQQCESTMSPWWETYPSTLQTLDDHQQFQSSMQSPHLTDSEVIASPATNWVFTSLDGDSPVRPSGQCSQHSSTNDRSCDPREPDASSSVHHSLCAPIIPISTGTHSSQVLGMLIQIPLRKTSQQHHCMTVYGLKIQFQIDICVSM